MKHSFIFYSPFFLNTTKIESGKMLVYDPVSFNKNITKNAFLGEKILKEFSVIYERFDRMMRENLNFEDGDNLVSKIFAII